MSNTDSRPPSDGGAHTIYGSRPPKAPARRKRWIWIVLGVVVAAVVLWIVFTVTTPAQTGGAGAGGGGRRGGGGRGGAGGAPTAVNAVKATQGDIPVYLNELGTATPPATVTVVPQVSGQLMSVGFHEGQMVKKGQFLAQIDPRPYQQQLLLAQATQAKDEATLANDRIILKRDQTLLGQDSIARQTVDTAAATVRQDAAQVKSDQANVGAQRLNLIYAHITAPVSGRVGLRQVDPGNYVTANTTNGLVVITQVDPMDVLFTLPEDNLAAVATRMRAGAVLPVVAFDRAQTTQLAAGKLFTLDNQVDTTTGTVRAKARFDNGDGALFPNQFVNVRLTVNTLKNVVIVPTSAVLKGPNGMFVYTVEMTRTVSVTNVTLGPAAGDNTAVLSGLDAGAVVVTDGSDRLKEGARVILPGDCIPAGMRMGGGASGGHRGGGAGAAPAAKDGGGFFGLFKKKAVDPMAALRCKPGQKPSSLLSGGAGGSPFALNFGPPATAPAPGTPSAGTAASGSATTTTTSRTVKTTTTAPVGAPAPAETSAPAASPPAQPATVQRGGEGGAPGGGGGGGGRGGRMQAMISALNLDAGQQAQAKAIFAAAGQQAQASGDMRAAFHDAFAKLEAILRPDQKAKLDQMRAEAKAKREAAGGGQSDQ